MILQFMIYICKIQRILNNQKIITQTFLREEALQKLKDHII